MTRFFERLGAPLANPRWSWGARRARDGFLFLRVWQDRKLIENGRTFYLLDRHGDDPNAAKNLGYQERLRHIAAVRAGAACYLVMCIARDIHARPRAIETFEDQAVFVGGSLLERNGDVWIESVGRRPVDAF